MAHTVFRDRLASIASANGQDPTGFLEDLSDVHDDWHGEFTRSYGFLLFHARVVRYFVTIVQPALANNPIVAFTATDFNTLGVAPFGGSTGGLDTLGELATFSSALESWHNTAHGGIGAATGVPMMDPRQNIFFRPFWQLHFYIDALFATVLGQYGTRNHPGQFVTGSTVAAHIEAAHHGWVPRI